MEMETEERSAHAAFIGDGGLNPRFHGSEDLWTSFRVEVGGELSRRGPRKQSEYYYYYNNIAIIGVRRHS